MGLDFTIGSAGQARQASARGRVREVLKGVLYVLETGCQWRALTKTLLDLHTA